MRDYAVEPHGAAHPGDKQSRLIPLPTDENREAVVVSARDMGARWVMGPGGIWQLRKLPTLRKKRLRKKSRQPPT